jgi:hypothetical protein
MSLLPFATTGVAKADAKDGKTQANERLISSEGFEGTGSQHLSGMTFDSQILAKADRVLTRLFGL